MATYTETERKYEVNAVAELPPLGKISGVAEVSKPVTAKLEAVYFDTADLRLLRHGVTLRRRTGGSDAGWHLKVPIGGDTREELREPLDGDRDQPPATLRDLTVGMAKGAELRPVARVDTDRITWELKDDKGKVLAEVTDDTVTASTLTGPSTMEEWRELEVELPAEGDVAVLDRVEKFLRRAGIRRSTSSAKVTRVLRPSSTTSGDTAGDVVLAYLSTQVAAIVRHDLGVRGDIPDSVHQMRVATRRLRSALRVFGRIVDRSRTAALSDDLRWLGRRLSPARDLEVQEQHFREAVAALPEDLVMGPVPARLTKHFSPAMTSARRQALETLDDERYRALLDELDRLLVAPPLTKRGRRPARSELPGQVRKAFRKTTRRMESVPTDENRERELHRTRKAAKRFRYAVECAEPAVGKKAKRSRKRAKALTRLLGEHQDGVVAMPLVRELGVQAHLAGENAFAFGLLHEQEYQRTQKVEQELPDMWEHFTAKKAHKWFR